MLKEIKIKNIRNVNIMTEFGSNKPILNIEGEVNKLEEVEEYTKLLESKNVKIVYEVKAEILDKEEKKYLGNLVRPFRDKVNSIVKMGDDREFITIEIFDETDIYMPYFEMGTMYKGMEKNRHYTLKELGL